MHLVRHFASRILLRMRPTGFLAGKITMRFYASRRYAALMPRDWHPRCRYMKLFCERLWMKSTLARNFDQSGDRNARILMKENCCQMSDARVLHEPETATIPGYDF